MNRLILVAALLAVAAPTFANDDPVPNKEPSKSTTQEEKYLNRVEAEKACKIAKETGKRVLVYQDWPS